MSDVCGFCKGEPVRNAAAWYTLDAPHYAACPRCGVLRVPADERDAERDRRRKSGPCAP